LPEPAARSRGRPRDPEVDNRIKRAALEVLATSGLSQFSVDAACLRAGVPRSTFYRRWPSALALVVDAFDEAARVDPLPDTGELLSDLVLYASRIGDLFADPVFGACVSFLTAEARLRPELAERLRQDLAARRAKNRELFSRAAARGETSPDVDPDLVFDVVNGLAMTGGAIGGGATTADWELVLRRLLGRGV
jgi:AcrR family transcriptional regulator